MIRINLLGDALLQASGKKADKAEAAQVYGETEATGPKSFPIAGLITFVILSACAGGYWLMIQRKIDEKAATKAGLEKQKAELDKYIKLEQEYRAKKDMLQKKKEVMLSLRVSQHAAVTFLCQLVNSLPDDVWFTEVQQKGQAISIKGNGSSFEAINVFRTNLMTQSKWFQNVNYPAANKKGKSVEFTMSFDLKRPSA